MDVDWQRFAAHRRAVSEANGRYIGLLDENGIPICDLPEPAQIAAPRVRNDFGSLTVTVPIADSTGATHPAFSALIDDTLGVTEKGTISPTSKTRLVIVERNSKISCFRVAQRSAPVAPSTLTIHGVDVLSYLRQIPCPSQPAKWKQTQFRTFERDWLATQNQGAAFSTPRDIAELDFYNSFLSDQVHKGPAVQAIGALIQESFDAVFTLTGKTPSPFLIEMDGAGPEILIRPDDSFIWDVVAPRAQAAGVTMSASMRFPDEEVEAPTIVIHIKESTR